MDKGYAAYKLLLTKADRSTLCALLDNKEFSDDVSDNVRNNFELFCSWLTDVETVERIYSGFQKLKVVEVVLQQNHDDPQAIFESLNSTGVDLSQADLIRNYVLMRQDYETQSQLYLITGIQWSACLGGKRASVSTDSCRISSRLR